MEANIHFFVVSTPGTERTFILASGNGKTISTRYAEALVFFCFSLSLFWFSFSFILFFIHLFIYYDLSYSSVYALCASADIARSMCHFRIRSNRSQLASAATARCGRTTACQARGGCSDTFSSVLLFSFSFCAFCLFTGGGIGEWTSSSPYLSSYPFQGTMPQGEQLWQHLFGRNNEWNMKVIKQDHMGTSCSDQQGDIEEKM